MFKEKRSAMVGILVLAVFLSLLTLTIPGKALAAYECFLKIEGARQGNIQGEATAQGYAGWIDITTWSFSGTQPVGTQPVGAAGHGTGIAGHTLKVTMRLSKASPKLFQAFGTGEQLKTILLEVRQAGGTATKIGSGQPFLRITLSNAIISSIIDLGNSKSTDPPMEEVTFKFTKVSMEYTGAGTPVKTEWSTPVKTE